MISHHAVSTTALHWFEANHLFKWLTKLDEDIFTQVMYNRVDKPVILAYIFCLTGLCPNERLPTLLVQTKVKLIIGKLYKTYLLNQLMFSFTLSFTSGFEVSQLLTKALD